VLCATAIDAPFRNDTCSHPFRAYIIAFPSLLPGPALLYSSRSEPYAVLIYYFHTCLVFLSTIDAHSVIVTFLVIVSLRYLLQYSTLPVAFDSSSLLHGFTVLSHLLRAYT